MSGTVHLMVAVSGGIMSFSQCLAELGNRDRIFLERELMLNPSQRVRHVFSISEGPSQIFKTMIISCPGTRAPEREGS